MSKWEHTFRAYRTLLLDNLFYKANNTNYLSALKNAAVFGASLCGMTFTLGTPSVTSATVTPIKTQFVVLYSSHSVI